MFVDPIFNMSANDDAGSKRNGARLDDDAANFVYTGQENVPAWCDSRPSPSVHQGDSREGIPSSRQAVDECGTSRWA